MPTTAPKSDFAGVKSLRWGLLGLNWRTGWGLVKVSLRMHYYGSHQHLPKP